MCHQCSKCCQKIVIRIGEKVNDDYLKWASLHGLEIIDIQGYYYLLMEKACSQLKDGICMIQDTKPELCKRFDCNADGFKEFKFLL